MPLGETALSEPKRPEPRRAEPPVAVSMLPDPEVAAIVEARHGDPFAFLGMHKTAAGLVVRAMLPDVQQVLVVESATGAVAAEGVRIHPAGFFIAEIPNRSEPFRYRLRVANGAVTREFDDIYRFPPVLGELDLYLLAEGNHFASYTKLGAHPTRHEGAEGVGFAMWAPNARSVSVVGDFNAWDGRADADAATRRHRVLGAFCAGAAAGAFVQVPAAWPRRPVVAVKGRPPCRAHRTPAGHRLGRRRSFAPCLA